MDDNEIEIKVTTTADTSGMDKAERAAKDLGDEAGRSQAKVKGLGDESKKTERNVGTLAGELLKAKGRMTELNKELGKTGDMRLVDELKKATSEYEKLSRVAKNVHIGGDDSKGSLFSSLFGDVAKTAAKAGSEAGKTFAQLFEGGVTGAFQALPGEVKIALMASAAVAAIGASAIIVETVSAALLAGIGAAGIGAGIAFAMQDPKVNRAFTELGDHAQAAMKDAAKPFKTETIEAIGELSSSFDAVMPHIKAGMASLAPEVSGIAANFGKGLEQMGPGLESALKAAGPLLKEFSTTVPILGKAFGDMFSTIAKHGQGASMVFKIIFISIAALVKIVTFLMDQFGTMFDVFDKLADAGGRLWDAITGDDKPKTLAGGLDDVGEGGENAADGLDGATDSVQGLDHSMAPAIGGVEDLTSAFDRLFGAAMGVKEADIAVAQGWSDLRKELTDGARTLDINTQAGRDNQTAILDQVNALNQKREADIAAGDGTVAATEKANAAYSSQIGQLRALLIQLGYDKGMVDAYIASLNAIPSNKLTTVTTLYVTKTAGGQTYNSAADAREGFRYGKATGGIIGAASGGMRGGLVEVGEYGRELVRLPFGSSVVPHGQSEEMRKQWASGGHTSPTGGGGRSDGGISMTFNGSTNDWLAQAVMDGVRKGKITIKSSAVV